MGRILLDTTILIDALRGLSAADKIRSLRRSDSVPYACAINIEEVIRGLHKKEDEAARRLFNGLRIAPLGKSEGQQAGEWRRRYAKRGKTLTQSDCLVAAAALSIDAILATGNPKDFPMSEIRVEHWPVGA